MKLDIAIGKFRNQKNWKNVQYTWDQLVKKIGKSHEGAEVHADYMALGGTKGGKEQQSNLKDIGGFVGAYLEGGLRHPHTVKHRQLVVLDLDFAHLDFWEDFLMYFGNAAMVHSTRKHSVNTPRLRLIMPTNRPMVGDEYEAVARRIAGTLGIDLFDRTTFEIHRLMYWPSHCKDVEPIFEVQDGDWIDVDAVLDQYVDWHDVSAWPVCSSENLEIRKTLKAQENPTGKKGLIGAFCRAFPLPEAIEEFIPDVYEKSDNDRYTYRLGESSDGAINYDDLFLYSHHNSDPANGLNNAFDLVRIHLFGHLDTDTEQPTTKRPSYIEMISLVQGRAEVIREIGLFSGLDEGEWLNDMELSGRGTFTQTINNILLIINNDRNLKGLFAYNQFDQREYITGPAPWNHDAALRPASDKDDAGLRLYLERHYKIHQAGKTKDAMDVAGITNGFHPVRDYLNTLVWDGVERLDSMFIDTLGANDTPYVRSVTRKAMVAAVARVFVPGIKFDYVLTLVGTQGMRKSMLFHELGKGWFSDSLDSVQGKDAYEQIQGSWIIEMAELSGLKKSEIETAKHFITKQEDRYRVAYGRRVENFPRQCVFFGTTNETAFLRDATGNRRFWPIAIHQRYRQGTINVDQIWAEAKYRFSQSEKLYLNDELEADAVQVQLDHAENDERSGLIRAYLETLLPEEEIWNRWNRIERMQFLRGENLGKAGTREREAVCVAEIWCEALNGDFRDMSNNNTKFIHGIMSNMRGWARGSSIRFKPYGTQRAYVRDAVDSSLDWMYDMGIEFNKD